MLLQEHQRFLAIAGLENFEAGSLEQLRRGITEQRFGLGNQDLARL